MVLQRRFQVVETHGDVRYSTTSFGAYHWKKGYLKISWDDTKLSWFCKLYFEANDRLPVLEERLIQKKLSGLPKSPEKTEEAGIVHFILSNGVNIWIRRNVNTYKRSLYAVANLLKQIKEGQFEDSPSPASSPRQYDSRTQSCPSHRYDNRWKDSPQKSFYGQQKCVSRSSPSRSNDLFGGQNGGYERVGTPKTYSRNNWSNGYKIKSSKCYSEGDNRYTYSRRRRLAFSPYFSDKRSSLNSFNPSSANHRKQPKEEFNHQRTNANCAYTKENNGWRSVSSSDNADLPHRKVEEKFKPLNGQTKDNLEAVCRSPLKSISSNGSNSGSSKRPALLDFPIPSKRLKLSSTNRNKEGDSGETLADPICDKATPHLRGFENLGNSCYMNSVLQALSYLDPFTKSLLMANEQLGEKLPERSLIRSLSSLLLAKARGDDSQIQILLEEIKEAVCHVASNFKGNYQHDAHEFLGQVLDQIKEEIAAGKECDISNPIKENFEFDSLKSYRCHGCSQVIARRETSNMLSLDIPKRCESDVCGNLQDLLDIYFLPQDLEFKCEKCCSKDSCCTETFATLPRILTIHLKRYNFLQHSVKVTQPVAVPAYLTLQDHINESTSPHYSVSRLNEPRSDYSWQQSNSQQDTSVQSKPESIESASSHGETTSRMLSDASSMSSRNTPVHNVDSHGANTLVDDKVEVICTLRKPRVVIQPCLKYGGDVCMAAPRLAAVGLCGGREDGGTLPPVGEEENKENQLPNSHSYDFAAKSSMIEGETEPDHEVKDMQTAVEQSLQEAENQEEIEFQKALQNSIEDVSEWTTEELTEKSEEQRVRLYRTEEQRKAIEENFEKGNLQYSYQLKSIVSHIGRTAQGGHYLSDIYDPVTDSWWNFNDAIVHKTTKYEVLHQRETSGYLFFYVAKETLHNDMERNDDTS